MRWQLLSDFEFPSLKVQTFTVTGPFKADTK